MDSEELQKEDKNIAKKATDVNTKGRAEPSTSPLIDSANKTAERLENANKRTEELLKKWEDLEASRRLGGITEGPPQEEKKKEIDPLEYSKKVLSGEIQYNE